MYDYPIGGSQALVWGRGQPLVYSLHCRLAKFRGLMYKGKYGAVIGRETRFFVFAQ